MADEQKVAPTAEQTPEELGEEYAARYRRPKKEITSTTQRKVVIEVDHGR